MAALDCGTGVAMQYEYLAAGRLDGSAAFPANGKAGGVVPTLEVFGNAKLIDSRPVKNRGKINEFSLKCCATGTEEHIRQGEYQQYP
jgi:hypothetical protein